MTSLDPPQTSILPPTVAVDLSQAPLRDYWQARAEQHTQDSYAGVPMSKFPEDLRVYEHLLWLTQVNTVIELGAQFGGSALWFRDRLRAFANYGRTDGVHVIAAEIDAATARNNLNATDPKWQESITLIEGDVTDPTLPDTVRSQLRPNARCIVIEDTAHEYDTTRAALDGFAQFVPAGGFFVVEDGCVDDESLRISDEWPRGVRPAIDDWLASDAGADFVADRDLELYGITCHPSGFLRRTGS